MVSVSLANCLKKDNNKILIIDFDILNNSLHTILGVNKYSKKIKDKIKNNNLINSKINIEELIIKINKNVDLISGINLIFDSKYKISNLKINNMINELKKYYNYIIIDNSSECFFDYTKNIINNSEKILFILEANLIEIKKAKNLLKLYKENWKVNNNKIKIIINKYSQNSIDDSVIKDVFKEYTIIGKIKFNEKYNLIINKKDNLNKYIIQDYEKIKDKI